MASTTDGQRAWLTASSATPTPRARPSTKGAWAHPHAQRPIVGIAPAAQGQGQVLAVLTAGFLALGPKASSARHSVDRSSRGN
jgi:hypothetical protein